MKRTTSSSTKTIHSTSKPFKVAFVALLLSICHSIAFPETETNGFNFLLIALVVMHGLFKINEATLNAQKQPSQPPQIQDLKTVKSMLTDIQTNLDVNSQALNLLVKTTLDEK